MIMMVCTATKLDGKIPKEIITVTHGKKKVPEEEPDDEWPEGEFPWETWAAQAEYEFDPNDWT